MESLFLILDILKIIPKVIYKKSILYCKELLRIKGAKLMKKLNIDSELEEKIYDSKFDVNNSLLKITTYFPLSEKEKQEILKKYNENGEITFNSIFSDIISDDQWNKTKDQIKNKFQNELLNID